MHVVKLGASKRDKETNAPVVQALMDVGEGEDDQESYGEVDYFGVIGFYSMPYPADERGHAEGVVQDGLGATTGAVIASRDTRTTSVLNELKPGETAMASSGPGFDSRAFCKKQAFAIVVGDDMVAYFDRENEEITISGFGQIFQMSAANGISLSNGKAGVYIVDDSVFVTGKVVLGGRVGSPATAVCFAPGPVVGVTGATVPAPGVFIGV